MPAPASLRRGLCPLPLRFARLKRDHSRNRRSDPLLIIMPVGGARTLAIYDTQTSSVFAFGKSTFPKGEGPICALVDALK